MWTRTHFQGVSFAMDLRGMLSSVWEGFAFCLWLVFLEKKEHCPPAHVQERLLRRLGRTITPYPGLVTAVWPLGSSGRAWGHIPPTPQKVQNWAGAQAHLNPWAWVYRTACPWSLSWDKPSRGFYNLSLELLCLRSAILIAVGSILEKCGCAFACQWSRGTTNLWWAEPRESRHCVTHGTVLSDRVRYICMTFKHPSWYPCRGKPFSFMNLHFMYE